ncbi:hypothetical protein V1264_018101 [Littorina saxatilis]
MESSDFDPMLNAQQPQQAEDMVSFNHDHTADGAKSAVPAAAPEDKESVRQVMLERLSVTSAHFAHLQRDSPDLTQQEKIDIAAAVLEDNPATFLSRFGKYLQLSDLAFFQDADKNNYEVSFHLKEIRHRCSRPNLIVKNRRYAAMKELESGGEYFGEEAMKQREPLLYEQMVGQFLTDEEKERQATAAIDRSDLRFSTILFVHMDDTQRTELYRRQKEREECQEEEEEEEDSEEDDDDDDDQPKQRKRTEMDEDGSEAEDTSEISGGRATDIWRQQLHEEFTAIMREQFLSGKDVQFDYSKVDDNPDYDSLATMGQDEEYQYFLAEPPQTVGQENSDRDRNSQQNAQDKMEEEQQQEEEEDDYMLYEPPPDLVAKSAHYVKLGSWDEDNHT